MITVSYKHPRKRKLIYLQVPSEKEAPKAIRNGTYLLYGVHGGAYA